MAEKGARPKNVLPIFIKDEAVDERCRVVDICRACESVCGKGSIDGATKFNRLWRVLTYNETSRAKLLTNGVSIFGKRVEFEASNPFVSSVGEGEAQGTKMTISGLPFSYSMEAVERNLVKVGLKPRSKPPWMKARVRQGHMTDWRDGRRVVWVEVPGFKHSNKMQMGSFSAFIYYKEMPITCFRCGEDGHTSKDCKKEELCFLCKKPGHRKGDAACTGKPQARRKMVWDLQDAEDVASSDSKEVSESESESDDVISLRGTASVRGRAVTHMHVGVPTRGGASSSTSISRRYANVVRGGDSTSTLEKPTAADSPDSDREVVLAAGDLPQSVDSVHLMPTDNEDFSSVSVLVSSSLSKVEVNYNQCPFPDGGGVSMADAEEYNQASSRDKTYTVSQMHAESTKDVNSPVSEFIKSVEFVELPDTAGKTLGHSKPNSLCIETDLSPLSSRDFASGTPLQNDLCPDGDADKSGDKEKEIGSLWDPLDSEELLLAASMAEERDPGKVSINENSPTLEDEQVSGQSGSAAAVETVAANPELLSNEKCQKQHRESGASVSGFVSVGKRVFKAILSPTERKKETSKEPKSKKK